VFLTTEVVKVDPVKPVPILTVPVLSLAFKSAARIGRTKRDQKTTTPSR